MLRGHNRSLLTCLIVWAMLAEWAAAQREGEPPLLSGGFVQQLRALPAKALETFHLSDSSGERSESTARTPSFGRTQGTVRTRTSAAPPNVRLPAQPTGRATLQRTHESPWLERFGPEEAQAQARAPEQPKPAPADPSSLYRPVQARQGFTLSDRQPIRDPEPNDASPELVEKVVVERDLPDQMGSSLPVTRDPNRDLWQNELAVPNSTSGLPKRYFPKQPSLSPRSDGMTAAGGTRTESAFEAPPSATLEKETLQQAPRVSRIPLPRANAPRKPSEEIAEPAQKMETTSTPAAPPTEMAKRIPALPTSASPRPGNMRISSATLQSSMDDVNAQSVTVPPPLEGATQVERQNLAAEQDVPPSSRAPATKLTDTGDPALATETPSTDPTSLGLTLPTTPSPSTATPDNSLLLPTLPELPALAPPADQPRVASPASKPATLPQVAQPERPTTQTASPQVALPQAAVPESRLPEVTLPEPTMRSTQLPKLVTEGLRTRAMTEPSSSPDQRLKMEAPHVRVVLNGPADIPIGVPAEYQVVVHNDDTIDLNGLILRMDIPAGVQVEALKPTHGQLESEQAADGLSMLTWGFENLSAGQSATAPMRLVASSSKNFAVAMEWTLMPIAGTSQTTVTAPRLELALEGPAEVKFAEPNVYRLHIRNPGTATARKVKVQLSAEQFGSSSAEIPEVAPGEEEVIDVELTFNQRGAIQIKAVAKEQSGLSSQTAISVLVRQAVVEAQMLAAEAVYHGSPAECRVRLSNSGDADAVDLQAVVQLPTGASLLSAPPGATLSGRELSWTISKLTAGSAKDFPLQLKLTGEGANIMRFNCTGPGQTSVSAQATTHVEAITDLKLFVNDPVAPAPVGGEVVYELKLTNRGSKAATNVKVIAQFSEGIEPVRGEGHEVRVVPGQALFEPITRIAAGETVQLQVIAQAAASGIHRFRVEVRSDETEVRLVQEQSTQFLEGASRIASPPSGSVLR